MRAKQWFHPLTAATLLLAGSAEAQRHVIGWQTYENFIVGNNNSGIADDTPDTNSTYDPTPTGSSSGNFYLTGSIGPNASSSGWDGLGQATNNDFLNGPSFGENLTITNYPLADGSPGIRIGPFGNPAPNGEVNGGTSSWKFSQQNSPNQLLGDFSITNHSDYHFELEDIHFDARGLANPSTSPDTLEVIYLATPGQLINVNTGTEVQDLKVFYSNTWTTTGTENVTQSIESVINSAARIPPGQKASFRFRWSGAAGGGQAQIDNVAFSGRFRDQNNSDAAIDPTADPYTGPASPNIIVIIADDQRWDATSYMQSTIGSSGRTARFPWLSSPSAQTPGMDRLSNEGAHFNNAFVVFSICSPSRATMLTGLYPHLHGVTDNFTDFPPTAETYATLLGAAGYATGYFGKWHMGTQKLRPGFEHAVTFNGQGTYFSTEFFDELGDLHFTTSSSNWVDDVSTENAIDFITAQNSLGRPFLAVLGFKTPHQPWEPPSRTSSLFSSDTAEAVPNLTVPPPYAPGANGGSSTGELREYMRTVVGIDQNVDDILTHLDTLDIADDTAVIYISDNGFFRGEHGLGDKRAAYEESLRIPLMIRYPAIQIEPELVDQIALNLDIAPTILDIAGLPIPETMQGRSLVPFLTGTTPSDWRDSFLFSYNIDPEFPTANVIPYLGLRRADGLKLVYAADNDSWHELYDADVTADPYEITNQFNSPSFAGDLDSLDTEMQELAEELGFMKINEATPDSEGGSIIVQAGDASLFQIEESNDLLNWQVSGTFEGGGTPTTLSLINAGSTSSQVIQGDSADYVLGEGTPITVTQGVDTLRVGSINPTGGRNAVLVFELPAVADPLQIALAELEVTVVRTFAQWDADLWVLGIKDDTSPIIEYSETSSGSPDVIKLQDAIFDFTTSNVGETVTSSPISGLTQYLQAFYQDNPSYTGGKYLFLRINPTADIGVNEQRYTITAAEHATVSERPKLTLYFKQPTANPEKLYYRLRYGTTGIPTP